MPSVPDQAPSSADSTSGKGRIFFRYFKRYCAVTTPKPWRALAKDFPHFPLVRYCPRRNSAISATPLPPCCPRDRITIEAAEAGPAAALVGAVTMQAVETGDQPADRDHALQAGQDGPQAHVQARAEGDVAAGVARRA